MRALLILFAATATLAYQTQTLTLQKGKIQFKLKPADHEEYAASCPRNICTCEADVHHIRILAPSANPKALQLINDHLKSNVAHSLCGYLDAYDSSDQFVTDISPMFVSVVEHFSSQLLGTGGSCHSFSAVHTYDLSTGKEYVLSDIIDPKSLANLRAGLAAAIAASRNLQIENGSSLADYEPVELDAADLDSIRQYVAKIADSELLNSGFFLHKGHLYIDVNGYYLSCAAGCFHPAEIPASLVTQPTIKALLKHLQEANLKR